MVLAPQHVLRLTWRASSTVLGGGRRRPTASRSSGSLGRIPPAWASSETGADWQEGRILSTTLSEPAGPGPGSGARRRGATLRPGRRSQAVDTTVEKTGAPHRSLPRAGIWSSRARGPNMDGDRRGQLRVILPHPRPAQHARPTHSSSIPSGVDWTRTFEPDIRLVIVYAARAGRIVGRQPEPNEGGRRSVSSANPGLFPLRSLARELDMINARCLTHPLFS